VISPEGCASILYRDPAKAPQSAEALGITADDALRFGIIDEILPEPLGGAHRDLPTMSLTLGEAVDRHFKILSELDSKELLERRYQRFRKLGQVDEPALIAETVSQNGQKSKATV
jgi:acetyl-CoA carboxylase carboxyl transferase subunit alpha